MNWVGGARSRVRQQADRKKQREFFERKRLQAKVKKISRPKSPQDGSKRTISKDLLFLQAVSKAHDGYIDDDVPLNHVKKLKLTGPRTLWPDRNISLPMSPIAHPSNLDLLDTTTCDTELYHVPTMFPARHVPPRVSTQKRPHHTVLKSFGPKSNHPHVMHQDNASRLRPRRGLNQAQREGNSLLTESVFSTRREQALHNDDSYSLSFMNESLGLRSKKPPVAESSRPMWKKAAALQRNEDKLISERDVRRYCGKSQIKFPDRNTKRQSLVAEKSYDHETPFNFQHHPMKIEKEYVGKELPRTKTSLLDFHANENQTIQERLVKGNRKETLVTEGRKASTRHMNEKEPGLPVDSAVEPADKGAQQWDSITPYYMAKAIKNTALTSTSTFDENPLSKKAGPTSCSTVFNESVLGPIWKHSNIGNRRRVLNSSTSPQQQQPSTNQLTSECVDSESGILCGGRSGKSAFEKMMSAFDVYEKTIQPQKLLVDKLPVNEKNETCKRTLFGSGECEDRSGGNGIEETQSRKWQDFVGGFTDRPQPAHKQWDEFTSGMYMDQNSNKPSTNQDACQRVPNPDDELQKDKVTTDENCNTSPATAESNTNRRSRLASISVMDELMCLEEIGSVGNSCSAVLASQELSFTPVVFSHSVPDVIDTKLTVCQRYMSENPLILCHTPANDMCQTLAKKQYMTEKLNKSEDISISCDIVTKPNTIDSESLVQVNIKEITSKSSQIQSLNKSPVVSVNAAETMNTEYNSINAVTSAAVDETSTTLTQQQDDGTIATRESPPLSNGALQAQTLEVEDRYSHEDNLCLKKNCVSVAVQCSLGDLNLLSCHPMTLEEKSTQTVNVIHTDTAVQAAIVASNSLEESIRSNSVQQSAANLCDDVLTLKQELDSMRNTVIWQSMMLRLYKMH